MNCTTCNNTGIEYDGAGHTCTACNGESAKAGGEVVRYSESCDGVELDANGRYCEYAHVTRLQAELVQMTTFRDNAAKWMERIRNECTGVEKERDALKAEVVSKYGDPEAFGERELVVRADIQTMPYGTKLYRHQQRKVLTPELKVALIKATDEDQRDVTNDEWKIIREFLDL